jgi:hypothetical protein
MRSPLPVFTAAIVSVSTVTSAQPLPCNPRALADAAAVARDNVVAAVDGAGALDGWRTVLDAGGAIGWAVTEYNVDARSTFVLAFDRRALRVYRAGAFGPSTDAAMHGCIDPRIVPEAIIPWDDVREIEAGNWVLWFKLRTPVTIGSDRGKRKTVRELKVYFHGAPSGDLRYYYNEKYVGHVPFWNVDVWEISNLRGIAVGPNDFQRRLQFVLATTVDPARRITLTRKGRGAGW